MDLKNFPQVLILRKCLRHWVNLSTSSDSNRRGGGFVGVVVEMTNVGPK